MQALNATAYSLFMAVNSLLKMSVFDKMLLLLRNSYILHFAAFFNFLLKNGVYIA